MSYINTQTLDYPVTESEIRARFPNTSFPVPFAPPEPYALVIDGPVPDHDRLTQRLIQQAPSKQGNRWVRLWTVENLDAETVAKNQEAMQSQLAKRVRTDRNRRLTESDWTQVADAPVDKAAWAAYRQALRDVTKQLGFPNQVNWPVAPV